jgi:uncharacterized protein YjbJ (UPF0337 family)
MEDNRPGVQIADQFGSRLRVRDPEAPGFFSELRELGAKYFKLTHHRKLTRTQEKIMRPSTQDKTEGKLHEVKGKIKEEIGKVTKNPNMEGEGKGEKLAGKAQKWIGKAEKAVGE